MQLNEFTFRIPRTCHFFLAYHFASCKVSCKPGNCTLNIFTLYLQLQYKLFWQLSHNCYKFRLYFVK